MSQQINLLLDELKPKVDWLALPVTLGLSLTLFAITAGWAGYAIWETGRLSMEKTLRERELKGIQQQVATLSKEVANRKPDPRLEQMGNDLQESNARQQQALELVRKGQEARTDFSSFLSGLSRQVTAGVWIMGLAIQEEGDMEIAGRLTDPSLLPGYIKKLNNEPAFQGRRFAALDMKGIRQQQANTPQAAQGPAGNTLATLAGIASSAAPGSSSTKDSGPLKYIEFTLRGKLPSSEAKSEGTP